MDTDAFRTTTTATTTDPAFTDLQELYSTLHILAGGIETLHDEGQRLSNDSLQNQIKSQILSEKFAEMQSSIEESHSFLDGVKYNQDILNQDVTSLKQKIDDMQYVSYDGTFVWKITNFKEKMSK